jgi:hypothetical protein
MLIGYVRVSKSDGSQTLASRLRRCSRQWQLLRFVKCDVRSRKSLFYRFHVVGVRRVRKPGIPLSVAYRCMHVWQRTCVKPSGQCSPAQATLEP